MKSIDVRDAANSLSSLIDAAERGEPTTITRDGKPAAVLVPVKEAQKLYSDTDKDFLSFLLTFPGRLEMKRDGR
ncbi:prevent-host-death protein [Rhodoplanes elegans]|uniref:Antitoxin n=1 Tax=Rhodoplanes elegans TaxID=29408 RepID=A0A327KIF7_9BRAD|nr:type II toxin-antitoxin system Phd/YefM family antitoxin [Rhodoplanes elegans]MBK5957296.1 prevent-host-death protein [Rhodoplanes elegans]RAI37884.1 prevent-host-death protein [Rhodoplanes elegans]